MTAKELAGRMNITEGALSASLSGNPTLERLGEIAEALGVPVPELFATGGDYFRCPHCGGRINIGK